MVDGELRRYLSGTLMELVLEAAPSGIMGVDKRGARLEAKEALRVSSWAS